VRGDLLAFLNFSHKGTVVLLAITAGAFVAALLVNLIPMRVEIRAIVLVLGVVMAISVVFTRPYGEDRAAWAIIFGFGLLAWFLAFAIAGILRTAVRDRQNRFANPS
jgi:peptidoglycan/LPS O-acetylase OafA/YrhL